MHFVSLNKFYCGLIIPFGAYLLEQNFQPNNCRECVFTWDKTVSRSLTWPSKRIVVLVTLSPLYSFTDSVNISPYCLDAKSTLTCYCLATLVGIR